MGGTIYGCPGACFASGGLGGSSNEANYAESSNGNGGSGGNIHFCEPTSGSEC
jgi:hypothetical protein